ncbi:DDE superfamily endonuclease [Ceratobasidium sp. AG-Ba]|nr:DDE superfamily endonuclease [Ceratobasidium sp. AG-Ba]
MAKVRRSRGYGTIVQITVSTWLEHKDELRQRAKNPNELVFKRMRQVEYPDVDEALKAWILQKQGRNLGITGRAIRQKARDFAVLFGYPDDFLALSNGWLSSLSARMGLRQHRYHGEAASAPIDTLADEVLRVRGLISSFGLRNSFNFDECALFFRMSPDKGLVTCEMSGVKADKSRITVGLANNLEGSEKLPPLIIGKARVRTASRRKTGGILANLNKEMKRQRCKILLLIDNAPSHIHDQKKYPNVRIEPFAPNLTAWIQPNDAGIIQPFKSYYRQGLLQKIIERDTRGEANIYKINQLEAMELVHQAWDQVTPTTIANCWRHTKLSGPKPEYPPTPLPVPTVVSDTTHAVAALQDSLDRLQTSSHNLLEPVNAPDYLALDAGYPTEHEWTDQEIVDQVRAEMRQADADLRGVVAQDGVDDADIFDQQVTAELVMSDAAMLSLNGLQDILSKFDPSVFGSDISALDSLRNKLSVLGQL